MPATTVDPQMSTTLTGKRPALPTAGAKGFAAWAASWFNARVSRTMADDEPIPTRASLLQRLKDPADHASWDRFHRTYRGLIHGVARRAGLNETEADEVVQETLIAVAKRMPEFRYDPAKDSFKGWLLQVTRWRIADQFRKREQVSLVHSSGTLSPPMGEGRSEGRRPDDDTARTATIDRIPDPAGSALTAIWDEEWAKHRLNTALSRIKRAVNPAYYEIYHLHVILSKPVSEVKRALGVNVGQIYLAKYRVGALLKKELKKLEQTLP
jgi:RNA polymerase sigma-70 factor (ECF subfamily)